jgi:CubicO group peptidase (beta-lactamase class C family)
MTLKEYKKKYYNKFSWFITILIFTYFAYNFLSKKTFSVEYLNQKAVNLKSKEELGKELNKFINNANNRLGLSGILIVSRNNSIELKKSFGRIKVNTQNTPELHTAFRIGSITKPFTALATILYQKQKYLNLNDSVCKFVQSFCSNTKKEVKIKHLLNHTSGLPTDFSNFYQKFVFQRKGQFNKHPQPFNFWLKNVNDSDLESIPGENFQYSNLGYVVLTHILENVGEDNFQTILKKNIFTPLKMKQSYIELRKYKSPHLAQGMVPILNLGKFDKGKYREGGETAYRSLYGAGAMVSTANDLLLWVNNVAFGNFLNNEDKKNYFGSIKDGEKSIWAHEQTGHGHHLIWHNGSTTGFYSYLAVVPELNLSFILLTNVSRRSSNGMKKVLSEFHKLVSEKEFDSPI